MTDDSILFKDEDPNTLLTQQLGEPWKILIVDDDQDVHDATLFALKGTLVLDRPLQFLHAYSGKETISTLSTHPDIALILLDAVMDTETDGLSAVRAIREQLQMNDVRIILRTGQPGQIPELDTISRYDINDYKTKNELTRIKLITAVITAIRTWKQLKQIERSRHGLEKIIEASNQFIVESGMERFAEGVITQMASLFDLDPEGIVCAERTDCHSEEAEPHCCVVIAAAGKYKHLINKDISQIDDPELARPILEAFQKKQNIFSPSGLTTYFRDTENHPYVTWIDSSTPLKDVDSHLLAVFCSNISLCASNIKLVSRLKEQAWVDPVLKIPNLTSLLDHLHDQLDAAIPKYHMLAIIDIDGFNQINELLGHDYGDEILKGLVETIKNLFHDSIFIARIASDMFGLLGEKDILTLQKLKQISLLPIRTPDGERTLSVSSSLTKLIPQEGNASTHLRNGIIALKRAKTEGIGQTVEYSNKIGFETRERIKLLHALKGAFATNKLFLMFQPQIIMETKKTFCFEALLRWKTTEGILVPPDQFIPLAEQAGLMVPMGTWILRNALFALKQIHDAGFVYIKMAVNVSAMQLRHQDFLISLDQALIDSGIPPSHLELEITESISIIGIEDILTILSAIRNRGISLAIDDFGTGYSSLSSIDRWPINRIKIDKAFIRQMDFHDEGARLVDLVIPLANKLSLSVLAEGVETESQYQKLLDLGCHEVQGFLFSQALVLEDCISYLRNEDVSISKKG